MSAADGRRATIVADGKPATIAADGRRATASDVFALIELVHLPPPFDTGRGSPANLVLF